jgi:hypothetical protein
VIFLFFRLLYGWLAGRTASFFFLHIVEPGPERTGHSLIIYLIFVSAPSVLLWFSFVAVVVCTFVPTCVLAVLDADLTPIDNEEEVMSGPLE